MLTLLVQQLASMLLLVEPQLVAALSMSQRDFALLVSIVALLVSLVLLLMLVA